MKRLFFAVGLLVTLSLPLSAKIQSTPPVDGAECNDGMYSTSGGNGTCSGKHGGVKRWLGKYAYKNKDLPSAGGEAQNTQVAQYVSESDSSSTAVSYSSDSTVGNAGASGTMPTTGGEPFLISALGIFAALGGLALRRRL